MTDKICSQALYTSERKPDQNSACQNFCYCRSTLLQAILPRQHVLMERLNLSSIGVRMTRKGLQTKHERFAASSCFSKVCTTNGFGATPQAHAPVANAPATDSQRISTLSLRHKSRHHRLLFSSASFEPLRLAHFTDLSCHVAAKQAARPEAVAERVSRGQAIVRACSHIFNPQQALCWQTAGVAA